LASLNIMVLDVLNNTSIILHIVNVCYA